MTHIDVDGVGYRDASGLLAAANRAGSGYAAALGDGLAGTGSMAGSSSFAEHFSPTYDEAAGAVVTAVDSAVEALGSLAVLSWHSLENHRRADAASALGAAGDDVPTPATLALAAAPDTPSPPPSEGGDPSSLPGWANVILDHVQGFLWPDADLDRLRTAAATWRIAAGHVDDLNDRLLLASTEMWRERSPEVPLALEVLSGLGRSLFDISCACSELAVACDEYADAVEQHREAILELVRDLIRDAVLIAAAGFVVGFFTGGGGNAVAAYINSGKLVAATPRFDAILDTLRAAAAVSSYGLGKASVNIWAVTVDVTRIARAAPVVSAVTHAPAVARSGGLSLLKAPPTFLRSHEGGAVGGHTLAKHVGKSDEWLRLRLASSPNLKVASTFTDEATAARAVARALARHRQQVEAWLASGTTKRIEIDHVLPDVVGRIVSKSGSVTPSSNVRVVLVPDPSLPRGYQILTAMVR